MPPFAPPGPSSWFPGFSATTAALRLPAPPPCSRIALARRFRLSTEDAGSPKFLGDPCRACPGLRSRRSLPEQASGASPLRLALSVLSSEPSVSSTSATNPNFGTRFRGPRARCLRFVSVVAFRSRKTRFRLTALSWPGGARTRWVTYLVSVCRGLHDAPPGRGWLGARSGSGSGSLQFSVRASANGLPESGIVWMPRSARLR